MSKVLFVCTGNTCRSPMAAALYKRIFPTREVSSAGLFADGSPYCDKSVAVLSELGTTLSGTSRTFAPADLEYDRYFVMSDSHKAALLSVGVPSEKITVLDIGDPFGGDMNCYRECRDKLMIKLGQEVTIREMAADDIPAVAEIERLCFSSPWSENALAESLQNGLHFWVAEADDAVIGYCGCETVLDEAYVTNVAVLPHYRGFGIGTRLTDSMMNFCRENGASFITLEVRESNSRAISVYKALGFSESGKRKNFYSDPKEDAVLMTKEFKE